MDENLRDLVDSSESLKKLSWYLRKSGVVLVIDLKEAPNKAPVTCLKSPLLDKAEACKAVRRPDSLLTNSGYKFHQNDGPDVHWTLQQTLQLKKLLTDGQKMKITSCSRKYSLYLSSAKNTLSGNRALSIGAALLIEFVDTHNTTHQAILLVSQSKLLENKEIVKALISYMRHDGRCNYPECWIMWKDSFHSNYEFRKVV